jgi:lipopolysaccharide export system ATP-binding protein
MRLAAEGLVKIYGKRRVVDGLALEVAESEIVGLLGPNGAGKTTTFYMILGIVPARAGRIFLNGQDLTGLPMYRRARLGLGYLPQEPSVFRKLTVEQNLRLILEIRSIPEQRRSSLVEQALAEMKIEHLRNSLAVVLSSGERRRVEIARALVSEPSFLLLDEPFTGIDPIAVADLKQILLQLCEKGIGILLTDHNVRDALAVTDRSYIISDGRILTHGASSELPSDPIARKFYLGETWQP